RASRLRCQILPYALGGDAGVVADAMKRAHEASVIVVARPWRTPAAIGDMDMGQQGRSRDHAGQWLMLKLQVVQIGQQAQAGQAALLDERLAFCQGCEDIALTAIKMLKRQLDPGVACFVSCQR